MNRTHIAVLLRAIAAHAEYAEDKIRRMMDKDNPCPYMVSYLDLDTLNTITHLRELLDSIERELNRP